MQDNRYKKLRNALDAMRITEYLSPDSVDLVEKLCNEYTRLLDQHSKLKKKGNNEPKPDASFYQHQIDMLNDRYGQVIEENEKLKKQNASNGI